MERQVNLSEGFGQGTGGGRNAFVIVNRASGFGDDLGVGMLEEFAEQRGFLAGERERGEDGLGVGLLLGEEE